MTDPRQPQTPAAAFRAELTALLPGYVWTLPRVPDEAPYLEAVGRISAGSNRLSTLLVTRRAYPVDPWYEARISGRQRTAVASGATLARAVRALQRMVEAAAADYRRLAADIDGARTPPEPAA